MINGASMNRVITLHEHDSEVEVYILVAQIVKFYLETSSKEQEYTAVNLTDGSVEHVSETPSQIYTAIHLAPINP